MSSNKTIKSIFIIFIKMFFGELVDFHLKGASLTKFSTGDDGKAATYA